MAGPPRITKQRLDRVLVYQGLAATREIAARTRILELLGQRVPMNIGLEQGRSMKLMEYLKASIVVLSRGITSSKIGAIVIAGIPLRILKIRLQFRQRIIKECVE